MTGTNTEPGTAGSHRDAEDPAGRDQRARDLRRALVDQLRTHQMIVSPAVEAAFLTVERERFLPAGTDLEVAYGVDNSVVTKRDEHGTAISSVSAAYIQARMLEQADLRPGTRVWEIGSGGVNAALIAEIVGEHGRVVSMDIDAEVTDRATALLHANGYGDRVRVLAADAEHGVPGEDVFDAIIVTVGAWDISPAWLRQLAPDGVLVLPLIMNGVTRTAGFRRDGDRLVSTSLEVAGFVAMQGAGRHQERVFTLTDPHGKHLNLAFDTAAPQDPGRLDGVLATEPVAVWSAVTFPHGTSWADLYLWFAWFLPGFCRVTADQDGVVGQGGQWFPFGAVHDRGFAYLVIRPDAHTAGVEFGARGYGQDAELAAAGLVEQVRAWNRDGRDTSPVFSYWPTGSAAVPPPADGAVMAKTHGLLTISWPSTR
ncbi:hypothetical protein Asp14428_32970 [Actinoplanes sp. NBRC 14428]|nr:hypothetical protein Asp14428_32970 [Actinoplanes sp. NBRC 14428]